MPNWCNNIVVFTCSKVKERKLKKLFTDLAKKEKKEDKGQLPEFFNSEDGFLFSIRWEDGVLYYDTRWSPNIDVMVAIAEHFVVDFTYEYSELMMQVYGEFTFIKGVLKDYSLDTEDFDQFDVNPDDEDTYIFEDKVYESDFEILDILLARKKTD
ncbi:MAG: hypothetical protein V4450_17345 [Bacteroidota bacterium]